MDEMLVIAHILWVRVEVTKLPSCVFQFRTLSMPPQVPCARGSCSPHPTLLPAFALQEVLPRDLLVNPIRGQISLGWYLSGLLTTEPKSHPTSLSLHLFSASLL